MTMTDNVIPMPATQWTELRRLVEAEQAHAAKAREYWPSIARHMAKLRDEHPTDQAFGAALEMHGITINKDDRAGFIWMGRLAPEALEDALARCERRSPQTFRREVEGWNDPYFSPVSYGKKPPTNTGSPAETSAPATQDRDSSTARPAEKPQATSAPTASRPAAAAAKIEQPAAKTTSAPAPKSSGSVPVRAAIRDRKRADEVWAFFLDDTTRSTLGKIHKAAGWPLVLAMMDLGVFKPSKLAIQNPTGRVLCPLSGISRADALILGQYDLEQASECRRAERELLPFLRKHGAEVAATPERFREIWTAYRNPPLAEPVAQVVTKTTEQSVGVETTGGETTTSTSLVCRDTGERLEVGKPTADGGMIVSHDTLIGVAVKVKLREIASATKAHGSYQPAEEGPIVFRGLAIWPSAAPTYGFLDAWYAFELYRFFHSYAKTDDPRSLAYQLMSKPFSFIIDAINPRVGEVFRMIAAHEAHGGEGETTAPGHALRFA
jgi:hypothetical protein